MWSGFVIKTSPSICYICETLMSRFLLLIYFTIYIITWICITFFEIVMGRILPQAQISWVSRALTLTTQLTWPPHCPTVWIPKTNTPLTSVFFNRDKCLWNEPIKIDFDPSLFFPSFQLLIIYFFAKIFLFCG